MKMRISAYEAADMLLADENANWSRAGALAMAEYLEQLEDDIGEEIEFDVVAIRCDFSEYDSARDCVEDCYDLNDIVNPEDELDDDEIEEACLEWLRERTIIIEFKGGIIVSEF